MTEVRVLAVATAALSVCTFASAEIVGFEERFVSGASNWRGATAASALEWFANDGVGGSTYVRSSFALSGTGTAGASQTLFCAHTALGSSGGGFAGNWVAAGVTGASFAFRHDLGVPIRVTGRFASPTNTPGAIAVSSQEVASGVWTTVTFDLTLRSPDLVSFEGTRYLAVFSEIGAMEFGFSLPQALVGQQLTGNFDFTNFWIVPAPGPLAILALAGVVMRRRR